jgi:hypothetical protein
MPLSFKKTIFGAFKSSAKATPQNSLREKASDTNGNMKVAPQSNSPKKAPDDDGQLPEFAEVLAYIPTGEWILMTNEFHKVTSDLVTAIPKFGQPVFVFHSNEAARSTLESINVEMNGDGNPWAAGWNATWDAPVLAISKMKVENGVEQYSGKLYWIVFVGGNMRPSKSLREKAWHWKWDVERRGDVEKEQRNGAVVEYLLEKMRVDVEGMKEIEGLGQALKPSSLPIKVKDWAR